MKITEEGIQAINRGEIDILRRCCSYRKKYWQFYFVPPSKIQVSSRRKELQKNRRTFYIEIVCMNETQMPQWAKVIDYIISGTCFKTSKCYVNKYGVAQYYLTPNWVKFLQDNEDNRQWVLPAPVTA